jgi:hypothetical protein
MRDLEGVELPPIAIAFECRMTRGARFRLVTLRADGRLPLVTAMLGLPLIWEKIHSSHWI